MNTNRPRPDHHGRYPTEPMLRLSILLLLASMIGCSKTESLNQRESTELMTPPTPMLPEAALELADADLARAAFVEVDDSLARAGGKHNSKVRLLPPDWRFVYVMIKLNDQVNNGGFHQFFVNMGGVFDEHLEDDIHLIPRASHQDVVQRAYDIYSKIDYQDQWDNLGKSWDYFTAPIKAGRFRDEDAEFYKLEPDFDAVIGEHVRKKLAPNN